MFEIGSRTAYLFLQRIESKAFSAEHAGRMVTKDELLDAVWGHPHVSEVVLKLCVNALRKALSDDPRTPRYDGGTPRLPLHRLGRARLAVSLLRGHLGAAQPRRL